MVFCLFQTSKLESFCCTATSEIYNSSRFEYINVHAYQFDFNSTQQPLYSRSPCALALIATFPATVPMADTLVHNTCMCRGHNSPRHIVKSCQQGPPAWLSRQTQRRTSPACPWTAVASFRRQRGGHVQVTTPSASDDVVPAILRQAPCQAPQCQTLPSPLGWCKAGNLRACLLSFDTLLKRLFIVNALATFRA